MPLAETQTRYLTIRYIDTTHGQTTLQIQTRATLSTSRSTQHRAYISSAQPSALHHHRDRTPTTLWRPSIQASPVYLTAVQPHHHQGLDLDGVLSRHQAANISIHSTTIHPSQRAHTAAHQSELTFVYSERATNPSIASTLLCKPCSQPFKKTPFMQTTTLMLNIAANPKAIPLIS